MYPVLLVSLSVVGGILGLMLLGILGALAYRQVLRLKNARTLKIQSPRGIAETQFVTLGGKKQWITIRGEDRGNPVLLVLHGGPGFPYSPHSVLLRAWEKHFTVVQWDQIGAGKTFGLYGKKGSDGLTFDRLAHDGIELVEFLRRHLGHEKVVLLSSSAGSLLGIPMVQSHPDLFHAYVATDLNVDVPKAEIIGYQATLERLRAAGNRGGVKILTAMGSDPSKWDAKSWTKKQQLLMQADPLMKDVPMRLLIGAPLTSPLHSLRDVMHVLSGATDTQTRMYPQLKVHNSYRWGTRFEVPFILIQGAEDLFTPTSLAQEYYAAVEAPTKNITLVPRAAHFVAISHPREVLATLVEQVRPLVREQVKA